MPRSMPSQLERLATAIIHSLQEVGVDHTCRTLNNEVRKTQAKKNPDATFIIEQVSEQLKISPKELFAGNGRKNERAVGIGFCAYYLHYIFQYDMEEVQYMLEKKEIWVCYKYSERIKELNPKNPADTAFIEIKKVLDENLADRIKIRRKYLNKLKKNEKGKRA